MGEAVNDRLRWFKIALNNKNLSTLAMYLKSANLKIYINLGSEDGSSTDLVVDSW